MSVILLILLLFLLGIVVAALPWWPYRILTQPQGPVPLAGLPSLPVD
jgi:hypothetical protein